VIERGIREVELLQFERKTNSTVNTIVHQDGGHPGSEILEILGTKTSIAEI
jgi:hypothetical protein